MRKSRLLVSDVAEATGLCPATVRNLADRGLIKSQRDWNDWRVFSPDEVEKLKQLAAEYSNLYDAFTRLIVYGC